MAYVRPRERKDGSKFYSVYWRDGGRGSKQECESWETPEDAEHFKKLVDDVGGVKAREIMRIVATPRQSQTLAQYLTKHVDTLTGIQAGTKKRYEAYVRNDLHPIGSIPLTALSRSDIAAWVNTMSEKSSAKTVKNKRDFLSGALKAAVKAGVITHNPAEDVRNPRWDRKEMVFLTSAEFKLLLSEIPEYWRPLVEFLVASGCRWSEATALQPKDIDISHGTVRVTKAWKTGAGGYTMGVPKTKKSVRTINVPSRVLEQLDLSGEWVFTNSGRGLGAFADGVVRSSDSPVRIHSFHPNVWRPAIKRAEAKGLRKSPRIHDLRHTAASWLIQAGRPLTAIQQQLGHESIATTSDVYGHLDRSSGQSNAAAIDAMLA
ncbi:tyrosine-type recombinase/integrase [Mycolicibacterium bacteremicum]|uniref:Site-specific integrase n=1 Tax=Mycolicibacterium bacteremicum TaxID=564198 RepID=A0A1W9YQ89_MYCBA|nr:site-specific integrase [Mycolicibacterium bacteremicum]MCV7434863.1 site-specific integrase [Mycolicibacterium bacteremicum]ORA02159.1 hypothetical protein BST17_24945 [Mycolicibacterium bacteremicum]